MLNCHTTKSNPSMLLRMRRLSVASLMLPMAAYTSRAAANDLNSFDVVGFRLGLSPSEVERIAAGSLKDASVEPLKKRVTYGSFVLDEVLFGTRIKEGKDTQWYTAPNKEFVQINYSLDAAHSVIYINRIRYFDNDTAPAIQSLMASLSQKYGPPAGMEGGGTQATLLYWSSGATSGTQQRLPLNSPLHVCGTELIADADPFGQMRNGNLNYNPQYLDGIWPKCGTFMTVKIEPLAANNLLVHGITVAIGDFRQLQATDHYMMDALKKGEADKVNSGASRALSNKAPL